MGIFYLPDLGEGLPDAEIREWYVKVGDLVHTDQPLLAMETAKAIVDIPSPEAGTIAELFGKAGEIIKTGAPLIRFKQKKSADHASTVVGKLETHAYVPPDLNLIETAPSKIMRATPAVRRLAKEKNIDLHQIIGSGVGGLITLEDLNQIHAPSTILPPGYEALTSVRRSMCRNMIRSHQHVVPVTIYDEVDIHRWPSKTDITVRLIRAIQHASLVEPALNAWFDETHEARRCFDTLNLGLAMDSQEGLFVPVLKDCAQKSDQTLRHAIETYKKGLIKRNLPAECFQEATFTLSNFGNFAGRFANPIIVPPTVAILGVGRTHVSVVADNHKMVIHPLLPLSLTFDHRAVTGGEATRFLKILMETLEKP